MHVFALHAHLVLSEARGGHWIPRGLELQIVESHYVPGIEPGCLENSKCSYPLSYCSIPHSEHWFKVKTWSQYNHPFHKSMIGQDDISHMPSPISIPRFHFLSLVYAVLPPCDLRKPRDPSRPHSSVQVHAWM